MFKFVSIFIRIRQVKQIFLFVNSNALLVKDLDSNLLTIELLLPKSKMNILQKQIMLPICPQNKRKSLILLQKSPKVSWRLLPPKREGIVLFIQIILVFEVDGLQVYHLIFPMRFSQHAQA